MKKIKFFLILCVCITLFSSIPTMALTITQKVRGKAEYSQSLDGSVGYYHAYALKEGYAYTYVRNDVTGTHYYTATTVREKWSTMEVTPKTVQGVLKLAETMQTSRLVRDASSKVVDFHHYACGYASSTSASGKLDSLEYHALQYYR